MNRTIWILPLLAVAAACNRSESNTVPAAGNGPATNAATDAGSQNQQAALPAGLDCVRNRLSPEQRQAVAQAAMEQVNQEDSRAQALLQAVDACGEQLSWSPEKRQLAAMFSMSAAGATGVRQALGNQGIQVQALDEVILSDRALMMAAAHNQLDSAAGRSFAARHRAKLERVADGQSLNGELGSRIAHYIAFIAMAQTAAARFASAS